MTNMTMCCRLLFLDLHIMVVLFGDVPIFAVSVKDFISNNY